MEPVVGGLRHEQKRTGYEDLSEAEMEAIMDGTKPDPLAEEEPEEEPVVEDDPEEVEDDEKEEEEAEEDPEDDEPEEDDEVEEDTVSVEDRLALMEKRLELESLKRERAEEATKRAELMASRNAGKAGFLKQQLEKKKAGKKAAKPESEDEDGDTQDPWDATEQAQDDAEQPSAEPTLWAEDRRELVEMAINEEGVKFANERSAELEAMPEGFGTRLQELVSAEAVPYRDAFRTSSIKAVRKLSRSLMATAYATARIEFADKKTAEATTRKAESVAKSKRRKKKAAISKSGAPKKVKGKPANYDDMSDEELESVFKSEFGHNYNGRERS